MIVLGADMHKRSHAIAAVAAASGALLGEETVQVGDRGFAAALGWAPSGWGRWRTAAMSRVQQVQLDDALAILLLLAAENDPRFDRTAARWVGRLLAETPLCRSVTRWSSGCRWAPRV
jgi:hypothetical protein